MNRLGFAAFALALMLFPACSSHNQGTLPASSSSAFAAALTELQSAPVPEGVDTSVYAALTAELARQLEERAASGKLVCTPPSDDASQSTLAFDFINEELDWRYYCTGDYDQNGEVNISDLTPLGLYFGEVGPFDPNSLQALADGDNNGEINIADVTPIGSNFGNEVVHYNIYCSSSADDYPTSNTAANGAGAELIGTANLNDSVSSNERRLYVVSTSAPEDDSYIWVRPCDGTSDGTPSNYVSVEGQGEPVVIGTDLGEFGDSSGTALIGDYPAAAIHESIDWETGRLLFTRATNEEATEWTTPLEVDAQDNPGASLSLAIIGGNPAIAYQRFTSTVQNLWYVRATDANGDNWATPVSVDNIAGTGNSVVLMEVDGHPAVAYHHDNGSDQKHVLYKRAEDTVGTAWPVTAIDAAPSVAMVSKGYKLDLAIVGGKPAIVYTAVALEDSAIEFVSAQSTEGSVWNTPAVLAEFDTYQIDFTLSLMDIGGFPGVAYFAEYYTGAETNAGFYTVAEDASGTTWSTPQALTSSVHQTSMLAPKQVAYEPKPPDPSKMVMASVDNGDGTTAYYTAEYLQFGEGLTSSGVVYVERGELASNGLLKEGTTQPVRWHILTGSEYIISLKMKVYYRYNDHWVFFAVTFRDYNGETRTDTYHKRLPPRSAD